MIKTNEEKMTAAIAYLRRRDKYILDNCKWVPNSAKKTDVRKTMQDYLESINRLVWQDPSESR